MSKKELTSRSLWIFFALTYGISWALWIPTALFGGDIQASAWGIPYMLGGFGPSVAGVIMVYRSVDREGRRDFWKRVIDPRRISVGWWFFIFLIFPALFAISFILNSLVGNPSPEFDTLAQIAANPLMLVGMLVIGIVAGPFSEEVGWRGFALDRLQARWSPIVSALILSVFWWAWHLPLFLIRGTTHYEWGFVSPSFWLFLIGIVPLSVLLTWSYNKNDRSILAATLLHFTFNFTLSLVFPFSAIVHLFLTILLLFTAVVIVIVDQ